MLRPTSYGTVTRPRRRRPFPQRVRRLHEWAKAAEVPDVIMKPIEKLKNNISGYSKAYDLPGCHRTSNMADRLMQRNGPPLVLDVLLPREPGGPPN